MPPRDRRRVRRPSQWRAPAGPRPPAFAHRSTRAGGRTARSGGTPGARPHPRGAKRRAATAGGGSGSRSSRCGRMARAPVRGGYSRVEAPRWGVRSSIWALKRAERGILSPVGHVVGRPAVPHWQRFSAPELAAGGMISPTIRAIRTLLTPNDRHRRRGGVGVHSQHVMRSLDRSSSRCAAGMPIGNGQTGNSTRLRMTSVPRRQQWP
jgi:hypothetical protein